MATFQKTLTLKIRTVGCCRCNRNLIVPCLLQRLFTTHQIPHSSQKYTVNIDTVFSPENKERCMNSKHKAPVVRAVKGKKLVPQSAVLVPLCKVNGEPSILFTLRSKELGNHAGEVSFPGGKKDESDKDLVHTALRETYEEIGIDPSSVDVWGPLPPVPGKDYKSSVVPVLGYCGDVNISDLTISQDEVAEVFHRTFSSLCNPENNGSTQFRRDIGYTLPVFLGGSHRIWGLSAIILHQTLTIIAPGLYTFKLKHYAV